MTTRTRRRISIPGVPGSSDPSRSPVRSLTDEDLEAQEAERSGQALPPVKPTSPPRRIQDVIGKNLATREQMDVLKKFLDQDILQQKIIAHEIYLSQGQARQLGYEIGRGEYIRLNPKEKGFDVTVSLVSDLEETEAQPLPPVQDDFVIDELTAKAFPDITLEEVNVLADDPEAFQTALLEQGRNADTEALMKSLGIPPERIDAFFTYSDIPSGGMDYIYTSEETDPTTGKPISVRRMGNLSPNGIVTLGDMEVGVVNLGNGEFFTIKQLKELATPSDEGIRAVLTAGGFSDKEIEDYIEASHADMTTEGMIQRIKEKHPSILNKVIFATVTRSALSGLGGTIRAAGGTAAWVKQENISKNLIELGDVMASQAPPMVPYTSFGETVLNPMFWATSGAQMITGSVAMMLPLIMITAAAVPVAGALGLGATATTIFTVVTGSTIGALGEAGLESGGAYNEAIDMGKSPEEASKIAGSVYWQNAALLTGSNLLQLGAIFTGNGPAIFQGLLNKGLVKGAIVGGKIVGGGLTESGQELSQSYITDTAFGRETQWDDEAKMVVLLSFITGGAFVGAGSLFTRIQDGTKAKFTPEQMEAFEAEKARLIKEEGLVPEGADLRALDAVVESDPDAKSKLEETVKEVDREEALKQVKPTDPIEAAAIEHIKKQEGIAEPTIEPEVAQKEPWQMTKSGILSGVKFNYEATSAIRKANLKRRQLAVAKHKTQVEQALSEGKPVPAEVLADYPDLAKVAPTPTTEAVVTAEAPPAEMIPVGEIPTLETWDAMAISEKAKIVERLDLPSNLQTASFSEFISAVRELPEAPPVTPEVTPSVTEGIPEAPVSPAEEEVAPSLPPEGASKRVFDRIQFDPAEPKITEKIKKGYNAFQVQMVDDLYNLKKTVDVLKKGGAELSIEENPYIAARLLKGITGKVNTFLEQGTFGKKFWKTEKGKAVPNYTGESLENILKEVREPADWQDFSTYMVARRTIELNARDIETGVNIDDANNAIAELEGTHKNFPDLAKRLNKYQDSLLVYANEMGLLSNDLLGKLRKNADYVPFYRVFNELQANGYMGKKMADIANPIKRIKGSEREIINPLESIVKNTYVMISAADRNNVGVMLANLVNKNPELADVFERVKTPITKVAQTSAKELGVEVEGMTEAEMEQVVDIFRPSFFVPGNEVTVLVDGKKQFYKVDKDLRDALLNLTREDIGMMGKILSAPAKWLRAGAILSPDFMARNPARDQLSAMAFSNYGFIPGIDFLKGVGSIFSRTAVAGKLRIGKLRITPDASYELFRQSGAEHAMMVSMDREYLQKSFKEITEGKKFTSYIKNPIEVLRLGSEFGERATRLGEFKKGISRGATPTQAGLAAREVTLDFAKAGATAHALNRYIPFFNATIRGWDKMIISFKDHPVRTSAKVFMGITLPSILLYLANRDDPRWDEIPQWQKDLFWIVMTEDHIYRIPKPFELGILFGSIPERFVEYLDKKDPDMLKDTLISAVEAGSPGFIPQALLPIIEGLTNFNFFKGREIVPRSRQDLPPELQYTRYTTTVSKEVGKLIKMPPAKIDNLINAWTGGLGRYATNILDAILEGTGISPSITEPSKTLADVPVLKAFVVRDPYGSQNESVNNFYEKLEDYQKVENALKEYLKTGDIIKFNELKEKHPELLFFYDLENDVAYSASARYLRSVARELSDLRKKEDLVFKSVTMSADEKRTKIDEIDRLKAEVAKRALALFPAEGPIVLEKQLFDASNQLGDVLNDVPLLAREKPDIYNMLDLSNDYKETLTGVTLADLEGKKIPKTVSAWYDKEESLSTHGTFPSVALTKINNDPGKGFTFEDYISQWQERQLITDTEELKVFDKRFKNAHQGNLTPDQISALRDYHKLSGDEQELFLEGHPELKGDPRDEWLKEYPTDNARLAIWGKANILTQEAYDIAQKMIKDLGLPVKALPEFSLPPRESVESHFEYLDAIRNFSASSAEARLILAQDDAYREWRELDEVDVPIPVLELQIKSRKLDGEYDLFGDKESSSYITDDDAREEARKQFKISNPEWWDDQRRIDALRNNASPEIAEKWVKRGDIVDKFSPGSSEVKVWLIDNPDIHQWALGKGLLEDDGSDWNEGVIRLTTKWRVTDEEYDALPVEDDARENFLLDNPQYNDDRRRRTMFGFGAPNLVERYVDYGHVIDQFSSGSSQAKLWRLEHPELERFLVGEEQWQPLKVEDEPIWRIDVEFEEEDNEYNALPSEGTARKDYLLANPKYHKKRYERQAYQIDFPMVDEYVDWHTNQTLVRPKDLDSNLNFYEDDWYLMEHRDFYAAMLKADIFTTRRDFRLVPMRDGRPDRVVGRKYNEYLSIRNNQTARDNYRIKNPDLDEWGVSVGIWTTTMTEKRRRQGLTEIEKLKEYFYESRNP